MINITDAEWKIMNLLWEESPRTIMQITKALADSTGWTKHTVMTLLKRLEEKGAVRYENGEKAKLYQPIVSKDEIAVEETKNFLQKAFKGKIGLMINTMIKEEALTKEDLEELYSILENGRDTTNE
ncbi:MAG: BlaI/MecI/CopY family transcriptional regulator [Lachnospiraceae bacterium]|nr:BlaI/MecI/CopY family transcriptional regulator [Lachnospiraceae bacterium]